MYCCVSMATVVTRTRHKITNVLICYLSRGYDMLKVANRTRQFKMCPCTLNATMLFHTIYKGYVTITPIVKHKSQTEQISSFYSIACTFVPSL